ncbi:disease resistance protein RPV1-like [Rhodamnia argentea]|uniref:Disease resistance protein RPV1-like n=1 Tax=Rhodamnia argentea TaxID=178133 RepID=A0A8B8Q458_9MYRT|nr:disease resistance protein RPV1-like [Rhodamnia argentea]
MAKEGPHGGSSSASSAPETGNNFDVFLSFRGGDTRDVITDVLYSSLVGAGVRTFRDEEELSDGESLKKELPKAIKLSKIGIPILSKTYASSKWCLRELAQMVEQLDNDGMIMMPVFFETPVDHVKMKDGKGRYADDIREHREKGVVDPAEIEKWESALKKVTSLKGRQVDCGQGEFAKMLFAKVLKKLRKAKLKLSDKLVGIEDGLTELRRMMDTDSNDVRMIAIAGISGIGKTTLAKSLYNDICHLFCGCSFLSDIQASTKRDLVALQNQLVSDIIRKDLANLNSFEEGVSFLEKRLTNLKVLILLDDVCEKTQLEALVGSLDWFGPGSRIIITTKYKEVLRGHEVTETYNVPEMTQGDALTLFCRYAFGKDCPEHDYVDLSNKIMTATGRLPLALELVGSQFFLFRDKEDVRNNLVDKLKRVPHDDVQKKLKITYELLLEGSQRHIFLDIACFLIGEDKRIASYMWKELDLFPYLELEKLCHMSLVKIGDDNRMWMHDQLRKLGRQIVQDDLKEHGKCSRLWGPTQAREIIQQDEQQMKVEALCLGMDNHSFTEQKDMDDLSQTCWTPAQFGRVPNLRLLIMDHSIIEEDFRNLLAKLLWLRWHGCPRAFDVYNLHLENLVVLDLSWSKVTEGWKCWNYVELSRKLKVLILRDCVDLIQTPNFSNFKALEVLVLEYCSHLVHIDPSIGELQCMQILDLKFCTDLSNLPRELDSLKALRELRLDGTSIENIPVSEDMKHLKTLSACNCKSLVRISSEIGDIKSLEFLSLDGSGLAVLPDSIGRLENLKQLSLRDCQLM